MSHHNHQQHQQMDMADMNRKFPGMVFNSNQFVSPPNHKQQQQHQQTGQPVPQLFPMMPAMAPPPPPGMLGGGMDYGRWMAEQSFQQAQQVYGQGGGGGFDPRFTPPPQHSNHFQSHSSNQHGGGRSFNHNGNQSDTNRVSTSRSPTPPSVELCTSPKFGPGPPIVTSERVKGPRGCNLFVFHLPNEITNWDMYLLFRRFGTILSVHTMVNKSTGLSKGFGFVSYSAQQEAHAAISEMDGFRLGKKRLKVQLKRSQDDNDDGLDDASCNEDDSDVFYPSRDMQQGHHLSPRHPTRASRQTSNDSYASSLNDASTSGHTTRASTPRGPHSISATDGDHYFEGVDSDNGPSPHDNQGPVDRSAERSSRDGSATGVADLFGQLSVQDDGSSSGHASVSAPVSVSGLVVVPPLVIIPPTTVVALQTEKPNTGAVKKHSGGK